MYIIIATFVYGGRILINQVKVVLMKVCIDRDSVVINALKSGKRVETSALIGNNIVFTIPYIVLNNTFSKILPINYPFPCLGL